MLYMDIMDGYFVFNLLMGFGVLEGLIKKIDFLIDVYLMVEDNDFFVEFMVDWLIY